MTKMTHVILGLTHLVAERISQSYIHVTVVSRWREDNTIWLVGLGSLPILKASYQWWGLLSQFPSLHSLPILYAASSNHWIPVEYHVQIWQMPQGSPEINRQSFNNRHTGKSIAKNYMVMEKHLYIEKHRYDIIMTCLLTCYSLSLTNPVIPMDLARHQLTKAWR